MLLYKEVGGPLPRGQVVGVCDGVADNFPSKYNTSFSQGARFRVSKHDEVFRQERDNEVLAVMPDRYFPFEGTINQSNSF